MAAPRYSNLSSSSSGDEILPSSPRKKKRRQDAGRRYRGRQLYCSELGITCHFCRQKRVEPHVFCIRCVIAFCGQCLRTRHGEDIITEKQADSWVCPKCRGGCGPGCVNCCNCGPCLRNLDRQPPKIIFSALRAQGFTNVHDFLVHLKTGETPECIAKRKINKGWCRTVQTQMNSSAHTRKEVSDFPAESPLARSKHSPVRSKSERMMENELVYVIEDSEFEDDCVGSEAGRKNEKIEEENELRKNELNTTEDVSINQKLSRAGEAFKEKLMSKLEESFDQTELDSFPAKSKPERMTENELIIISDDSEFEEGCVGSEVGIQNGETKEENEVRKNELRTIEEVSISQKFNRTGEKALVPTFLQSQEAFKEKLMRRLEQCFDQSELDSLWRQITHCKNIYRSRETRHGTSTYPTKKPGCSYLDHHPDLAHLLNLTSKQEERLKILRGFFFWLEHAATCGAFKPWVAYLQTTSDYECVETDGPDCQVLAELCPIDDEKSLSSDSCRRESGVEVEVKLRDNLLYESECEDVLDVKPKIDSSQPSLLSQRNVHTSQEHVDIKPKVNKGPIHIKPEPMD